MCVSLKFVVEEENLYSSEANNYTETWGGHEEGERSLALAPSATLPSQQEALRPGFSFNHKTILLTKALKVGASEKMPAGILEKPGKARRERLGEDSRGQGGGLAVCVTGAPRGPP